MNDPTLTPDPTPIKSANLFEAVEAIKSEFPKHCDWSEVDYYIIEAHWDSERNRKRTITNKQIVEQLISLTDLSDNTYIKNQLRLLKL